LFCVSFACLANKGKDKKHQALAVGKIGKH